MGSHGLEIWYDKEEGRLDLLGMLNGVAQSAAFCLYATNDYFTRPYCLFELSVARELDKPIVTIRESDPRHHEITFEDLLVSDSDLSVHEIIESSRDYYTGFVMKVMKRLQTAWDKVQQQQ